MDFSWSEMMLVGIVALIVIGPKDLPGMFRELGRMTAKVRSMGREFSRAMEQAAKESGVKEATDGLKTLTNPVGTGLSAMKSAADKFEKWDPTKTTPVATKPLTPPPMPATAAASTPLASVAEAVPAATEGAAMGPATAALYQKKAAQKTAAKDAAAQQTAIAQPEAPAPAPKTPGRRRKKAEPAGGDTA